MLVGFILLRLCCVSNSKRDFGKVEFAPHSGATGAICLAMSSWFGSAILATQGTRTTRHAPGPILPLHKGVAKNPLKGL